MPEGNPTTSTLTTRLSRNLDSLRAEWRHIALHPWRSARDIAIATAWILAVMYLGMQVGAAVTTACAGG